ncbi:hypothetical protein H4Q26_003754 [Puccinia striiformis f. sp. tritici PST-130]|nr:hypothetical protein H4Q26_003754 [Puccinia striiformis f. sp. tritici PST-130]
MFPAVYVACLLVATAIASPVHHEARGFSSYSQDSAQSARNHGSQASVGPFGGSMSSHDDASSATSHNSGSTMIGGGVGGFGSAGGFRFADTGGSNSMSSFTANSMSAANSFSAGGIGGGVGGFGMNQQNSFSASSAISNFQNVNSMMAQMQSTLMSGSMSSTVAYQSMLQLAQSFQIAMTQATACTSCFAGQGSQFASVASSTFNQFTRFISQMQGAFGGHICTPFGQLGNTFQSFFQHASSFSTSSSSSSNDLSSNTGIQVGKEFTFVGKHRKTRGSKTSYEAVASSWTQHRLPFAFHRLFVANLEDGVQNSYLIVWLRDLPGRAR